MNEKTNGNKVSTRSHGTRCSTPSQAKAQKSKHNITDSDHQDNESDNESNSDPVKIHQELKDLILKTVQSEIQCFSASLNMAVDENKELKNSISLLEKRLKLTEGLLQQAQKKLMMQNEKIIDLQTRSMRENLVIQGIDEDDEETWSKTQEKVVSFMKNDLKINNANKSMVDRAHRVGQKNARKPRNVVVKLASSSSKDLILKNVGKLAGKTQFSVQEQFPPEINERRRRLWPIFKEAKEKKKQDRTYKVNWSLDRLYVNGKQHVAKDDFQHINPTEHLK